MARSKITKDNIEIKDAQLPEKEFMDKDVVDIEFKELQKKKFRLDRDNARVIELNTSDISVIQRLEEIYPKMLAFVDDAQEKIDPEKDADDAALDYLMMVNDKMKELLNWAFDSDIADKACPSGTLYDPINGKFRFEYIMERLIGLYDENFAKEFNLMQRNIRKHTGKYTNKRK